MEKILIERLQEYSNAYLKHTGGDKHKAVENMLSDMLDCVSEGNVKSIYADMLGSLSIDSLVTKIYI